MTTLIALSDNQTAWSLTLVVGLVVLLVVLALLEALRRAVSDVNLVAREAWEAGRHVEFNTFMIYLLKSTRERGAELVEELGHHR